MNTSTKPRLKTLELNKTQKRIRNEITSKSFIPAIDRDTKYKIIAKSKSEQRKDLTHKQKLENKVNSTIKTQKTPILMNSEVKISSTKNQKRNASKMNLPTNMLSKMNNKIYPLTNISSSQASKHTQSEATSINPRSSVKRHKVPNQNALLKSKISTYLTSTSSVCLHDPCGEGVACFPKGNSYTCVCSDGTELKTGEQCPNIRPVNLTPPAVSMTHTDENSLARHSQNFLIGAVASMGLFLLLSIILIYWRRKKIRQLLRYRNDFKMNRISDLHVEKITGPQLTYDFTSNPHYFIGQDDQFALDSLSASLSVKIIAKKNVEFLGEIGEGCFGKVYRGQLRPWNDETLNDANKNIDSKISSITNNNNVTKFIPEDVLSIETSRAEPKTVAVKILKESLGNEAEQDFMREVEMMATFKHPNILSLIGIVKPENASLPWMIFEYMPYGDLAEVLRSSNQIYSKDRSNITSLSEADLLNISFQVSEGMEYLAQQHFVHRDLASRNCLVGENLTVKISDFGMSRDVYTCDYYKVGGSRMLPIRWMAPESIMYGKFTLESDIWSFGVVLWEIYSLGKQPYFGNTNEEVVKLILDGVLLKPPNSCPAFIKDIMRLSWCPAPHKRLTFTEVLDRLRKGDTEIPGQYVGTNTFPKRNFSDRVSNKSLRRSSEVELDSDEYLVPMFRENIDDYLTVLPDVKKPKPTYCNIQL